MPNSPGMEERRDMLDAQERGGARDFSKLTISDAQFTQPWTIPYSGTFVSALHRPGTGHLMGTHAVLHAQKTIGSLAAVFEGLDHSGDEITDEQVDLMADKVADLMTAAMRLANLYKFSLARRLVERSEEKNRVRLDW